MDVVRELVEGISLPQMTRVRQIFDDTHIEDLEGHLQRILKEAALETRIKPGETVALGVGSRGLAELPLLVRTTVAALKAAGAEPFVVPAMGSHGGATDAGQAAMLACRPAAGSAGCRRLTAIDQHPARTVSTAKLVSSRSAVIGKCPAGPIWGRTSPILWRIRSGWTVRPKRACSKPANALKRFAVVCRPSLSWVTPQH